MQNSVFRWFWRNFKALQIICSLTALKYLLVFWYSKFLISSALKRHKLSKWPSAELKFAVISVFCYFIFPVFKFCYFWANPRSLLKASWWFQDEEQQCKRCLPLWREDNRKPSQWQKTPIKHHPPTNEPQNKHKS